MTEVVMPGISGPCQKRRWVPLAEKPVLATISGKLNPSDFKVLRETATTASLFQRQERDLERKAQQQQAQEEAQWIL